MIRNLILGCVLMAMMGGSLSAQKAPGGGKKGGNRTIVDRWNRMSEEERQRKLAKLPPERRQRIERELQNYRSMSPEERRQLRSRYDQFNHLPPETQNQARRLFRQFNQLPEDRRQPVKQEFERLRGMSPSDRKSRLASPEFQEKYDPDERRMLRDLSGLVAPVE
jgi:hypothetical protein